MALVSPGISITVNDQSQYVNSNVGSVPLVILATQENKTYNGSTAVGTIKENAGKLLAFTSQRDLVTQMGTPTFQVSSGGTPVNGSELNEYGLLTAYSALGLGNQCFAIRADVDLTHLVGTSVRPIGDPANLDLWLDTVNTEFGLYELDRAARGFSGMTPDIITNKNYVFNDTPPAGDYVLPTPKSSYGNTGDYAIVAISATGTVPGVLRLWYKCSANETVRGSNLANTWVQVGSPEWQKAVPAVVGTSQPTYVSGTTYTLTINTSTVTVTGITTAAGLATAINSAAITGVFAGTKTVGSYTYLTLFATSAATGNGSVVDGKLVLTDGTATPLALAGVPASSASVIYGCPILFYGSYAQAPSGGWFTGDTLPRPSGSIWWKTTSTGGGWNPVIKEYSSTLGTFSSKAVPMYSTTQSATYLLDPIGGGINVDNGQLVASYGVGDYSYNSLRISRKKVSTVATATGGTTGASGSLTQAFVIGDAFTVTSSYPGATLNAFGAPINYTATVTLNTTTADGWVAAFLAAEIPYVTASYNVTTNTITITHLAGGYIGLVDVGSGDALAAAGFGTQVGGSIAGSGYNTATTGGIIIQNWDSVTSLLHVSENAPYTAPDAGTYWYYSNPADIDIMINDGAGWKGYKNVGYDVRGYNLGLTDSSGVIVSATRPVAQTNGTSSLAAGDLWLDSSDLVNYPSLYRYNGTDFIAIDTTDHVTSDGIVFADVRWDTDGESDVISGDFPVIGNNTTTDLLHSNYIDLDAPDYRLYPRGALVFNTRRSGYNVKKFVPNYFNEISYPDVGANSLGYPTSLPTVADAWITESGLDNNGVMKAGSKAQRAIVIEAMKAAVDSNLDVLSSMYNFNLIVAPGYPELISNMITLNDNRGDTAFIIGDTPLTLAPNTIDITNWVNNTDGNGLPSNASAAPYLGLYYPAGRTNDLAGNEVVVPASHAALRTFLYNDQIAYPWFAPAGTHRGLVANLSDIGYINSSNGQFVHNSISQGLRDALYTLNINPICQLPNIGLVVWGQLTRSGTSTARNRINVVRLENYLRTVLNSIANGYLFEPNDIGTRKSISRQIQLSLHDIQAKRGLYDFLVICDTSNNTPATISNNQLYVDIAIEPSRDVEFIYIPIAIYNPGSIKALNTQST